MEISKFFYVSNSMAKKMRAEEKAEIQNNNSKGIFKVKNIIANSKFSVDN